MKKLMLLLILCLCVSSTTKATTYEDIAELILPGMTPRLTVFNGDYCYGISRDGELAVFDISDIHNLTTFTTKNPIAYAYLGKGYSMAIKGDYMYAAGDEGVIVDISNASSPVVVGSFDTLLTSVNMIVSGDYLISANFASGVGILEVFDIATNPQAPVSVHYMFTNLGEGWSVAEHGNYLYFATGVSSSMLHIIDFTDPMNLNIANSISVPALPYHLNVIDNKLVGTGMNDAFLWDITTNPLVPALLDSALVKGKVCAIDNLNLINHGTVHNVNGSKLEFLQNYNYLGSKPADGFPYGGDVIYNANGGIVAIAQSARILILRTATPPKPLVTDVDHIYCTTGGLAKLTLDATITNAKRKYLILGGVSGPSPGIPLAGGAVVLPINWDIFTAFEIANLNTKLFDNFLGVLNSKGQEEAKFSTLGTAPGALAGLVMVYAYALRPFDFVSNYVKIEFRP